jgi:hypothetical protein
MVFHGEYSHLRSAELWLVLKTPAGWPGGRIIDVLMAPSWLNWTDFSSERRKCEDPGINKKSMATFSRHCANGSVRAAFVVAPR